ncbi:MAG: hypothetical protein K5644_00695 [Lachnospiraceae bacterium]|nr:hypothetical protein [Lachnospiraceae bacterium]
MDKLDVNRREIARYLGYKSIDDLDDKTAKVIDECINEIMDVIEPKSCYDTFPIQWNNNKCEFAGIDVTSKALIKNLAGCSKVIMAAVTIGPGVDRLIRRAEVRDMSKAYILQCVGTEVVEAWCNKINRELSDELRAKGLYTRPRFSPGYGDLPLELQQDFERVLKMRKNIGISLSSGAVMTPTKSVTAIIGISDKERNNAGNFNKRAGDDCEEDNVYKTGCDACNMNDTCTFKK